MQRSAVLRYGLHDRIWHGRRDFGLDVQHHLDLRSDEAGQVRDYFVGDAVRVMRHARRIECEGSVEALRLRRTARGRYLATGVATAPCPGHEAFQALRLTHVFFDAGELSAPLA